MPPFRHPSSLVRFLVSQGVPFANYVPRERSMETLPEETYRRPSLYMFWFFILFLMFLILGYYSVSIDAWWGFIPAILSFGLSLFFICMLMTRFCYLTLDGMYIQEHGLPAPVHVVHIVEETGRAAAGRDNDILKLGHRALR